MRLAVLLFAFAAALPAQRVRLILHADDLGMSHSVNAASIELLEAGAISSGSIMMPTPWVSEIAAYARRRPEKDLGLHLTLTSEWKTLRWGPVGPRDKLPGLLDPHGYLWPDVRSVVTRATAQEVEAELRAQIEMARRMGIRFTHLDTHMGTLYARPDYFQVMEKLGGDYGVPVLRMKPQPELMKNAQPDVVNYILAQEERYQRDNVFRLDTLLPGPADGARTYQERRAAYHKALRSLRPGVHMIIIHPGVLDEELKSATSSAANRDADRRIFFEPETRRLMKDLGIELTGWRDVAPANSPR
jgi:hypothetical protein